MRQILNVTRLYGGIHPSVDDLPGRILGSRIGTAAFDRAVTCFECAFASERACPRNGRDE